MFLVPKRLHAALLSPQGESPPPGHPRQLQMDLGRKMCLLLESDESQAPTPACDMESVPGAGEVTYTRLPMVVSSFVDALFLKCMKNNYSRNPTFIN